MNKTKCTSKNIRYHQNSFYTYLTINKLYTVISLDENYIHIIDDKESPWMYPIENFDYIERLREEKLNQLLNK